MIRNHFCLGHHPAYRGERDGELTPLSPASPSPSAQGGWGQFFQSPVTAWAVALIATSCCWSTVRAFSQEIGSLVFVDAPRVDSRLLGIQDQRLLVEIDGRPVTNAWDQIVCWGWPRRSVVGQQLLSRRGDIIVGDVQTITNSDIHVAHELFGVLKVSRSSVAGIVFRPPADLLERDRLLRRIVESKDDRSSVILTNGDELDESILSGSPLSPGQPLTTVQIGSSNTEIKNIVAAIFGVGKPASQTDKTCWFGFRDGSRLAAKSVKQTESRIEIVLQDGLALTADAEQLLKHVVWVQPTAKRFSYLSQLPSAGYKHLPFFGTTFELGVNRNTLGGNFRCSGHEYAIGLGMHSAARVAYDLDQKYRWLEADIAIDDAANNKGAAVFRVFVERTAAGQRSPWQMAFESAVMRGNSRPVPVRVDIANAGRIALVVDFAERGDECDYADWLNARVLQ